MIKNKPIKQSGMNYVMADWYERQKAEHNKRIAKLNNLIFYNPDKEYILLKEYKEINNEFCRNTDTDYFPYDYKIEEESIIISKKEYNDIKENKSYKILESIYEAGESTCAYLKY